MLSLSLYGESQLGHFAFWAICLAWTVLSIAAIWWLRKGLLHLPASRLLPVEYGCVTATSVLGGLILFREHQYVPAESLGWMGFGLVLICIGCALVGRRCGPSIRALRGAGVGDRAWLLTVRSWKGGVASGAPHRARAEGGETGMGGGGCRGDKRARGRRRR